MRRESVSAGPVAFLGAKTYDDHPDSSRPGIRIPVKTPILVKAGPAVTVTLSADSQREALITVGRDRKPYNVRAPSIELEPCPPDATVAGRPVGRRTPFPGGFKLHGPTCVTLTVEVAGQVDAHTRQIGFGTSCREA